MANPDVAQAGVDPLKHYLEHGRREGRAPSPDFDPQFYLQANPDVAQAGLDPFVHYILYGRAEGRPQSIRHTIAGSGLFDREYYRAAYLDVALSGNEPLQHFIDHGRREGRRPSLDFDPSFYRAGNPDLQREDIDLVLHYIEKGRAEGRCCRGPGLSTRELQHSLEQIRSSGWFDEGFYLRQSPAVREAGVDPLFHYAVAGFASHLDPSPAFSSAEYTLTNPEVRAPGLNPLLHLLNSGGRAGGEAFNASPTGAVAGKKQRRHRPDEAISLFSPLPILLWF